MSRPRAAVDPVPTPAAALPRCASPVCRAEVDPADSLALEVLQRRADQTYRWFLCDTRCLREYLALCAVKGRAAAEARP